MAVAITLSEALRQNSNLEKMKIEIQKKYW